MHCSKCGTVCASGLTYCPRCGAKLPATDKTERSDKAVRPDKMLDNLAITIIFVALFGFGSTFVTASELSKQVSIWAVIFLTTLMLATTLAIAALLIRQIARVLDFSLNRKSVEEERTAITEREMPQIESAVEYVASVTEATTRELEPSLEERN